MKKKQSWKLSEEQRKAIHVLRFGGKFSYGAIGRCFSVSKTTVINVLDRDRRRLSEEKWRATL